MAWSRNQRRGLFLIVLATAAVTAGTIAYLWLYHGQGIAFGTLITMALIIGAVWTAIGAVMAFYVVMIIGKNERIGKE